MANKTTIMMMNVLRIVPPREEVLLQPHQGLQGADVNGKFKYTFFLQKRFFSRTQNWFVVQAGHGGPWKTRGERRSWGESFQQWQVMKTNVKTWWLQQWQVLLNDKKFPTTMTSNSMGKCENLMAMAMWWWAMSNDRWRRWWFDGNN